MKTFIGEFHRETEKAWQISFDTDAEYFAKIWMPKSQIQLEKHPEDQDAKEGRCEIKIPAWLLKKTTATGKLIKATRKDWAITTAKGIGSRFGSTGR